MEQQRKLIFSGLESSTLKKLWIPDGASGELYSLIAPQLKGLTKLEELHSQNYSVYTIAPVSLSRSAHYLKPQHA